MKFLSIFALIVIIVSTSGCTPKKQEVQAMDPKEAYGMLRNDFAVLLDVREENEISQGMVAGSLWMPFTSKIEKNAPEWESWRDTLPKDKLIIVYCRSGRRSGIVAELLAAKGFRVANMGAFDDWVKAGLPLKKSEPENQ